MYAEATLNQTNLFAASRERVILAKCLLIKPELFAAAISTRGSLNSAVLIGVRISDTLKFVAEGSNVVMDRETLQNASLLVGPQSKVLRLGH
ncbi:hypothetical protein CBI38_21730 [Rhodococcus oxybenzonivorans]|uniref:Uncharacterized protein n=1 Tax=Rhodococcus oxybenzonivorans TaxID=1990687 RepID=A0A2S2BZ64_9NOCA|nr:hypothetical protein [Rhodococcus oxybenzonivorans]AWK73788.1 hypothetical protein CBI38_21730 [Rhodococcus oxybenzonivorans]